VGALSPATSTAIPAHGQVDQETAGATAKRQEGLQHAV
jgi:hypothetical protein